MVFSCAIGDDTVDGMPYSEIVEEAREYINSLGGFEKFAEWGFVLMAKTTTEMQLVPLIQISTIYQ